MTDEFRFSLSDEDIDTLRAAWSLAKQNTRGFAIQFYMHLFRRYPELEVHFTGDFHRQAGALEAMLDLMMETLDRPQVLSERMPGLALRHQQLGVTHEDYRKFGEILREEILSYLPPEQQEPARRVLGLMYEQLSSYMEMQRSA